MQDRLNFPPYRFRLSEGRIWDALRKKWLALTPEEWVRQNLVRYLIEECEASAALLVQEWPVELNGTHQRADVVVTDRNGRPILLAECKAPHIKITAATFAQAVRYNSVIGARYVVVTNGLRHFVRERTPKGEYVALEEFPKL